MFLNLRNNWPHNAVYKARNGTYLEGDCNLNILVSICITVMASSHEVNMNVHMHAHTLGSCCFRCRFLPLSFIISWAGYTRRKERRGMRVFGSPLCHHGPTYRMCHLQRMSFCPPPIPPLSVLYSQLGWWWDATPHGRWSERAEMHTRLCFHFF